MLVDHKAVSSVPPLRLSSPIHHPCPAFPPWNPLEKSSGNPLSTPQRRNLSIVTVANIFLPNHIWHFISASSIRRPLLCLLKNWYPLLCVWCFYIVTISSIEIISALGDSPASSCFPLLRVLPLLLGWFALARYARGTPATSEGRLKTITLEEACEVQRNCLWV